MRENKLNVAIGVALLWLILCMGMTFTHRNGWGLLTTLFVAGAFASGYAVPCKVYALVLDAIGETAATIIACVLMIVCVGSTSWVFIGLFVKAFLARTVLLIAAYGALYGATSVINR